jgi:hypothetical protein
VVTVAVAAEGGTFTVTFGGQTTAAIDYDAAAAAVQAALESLSTVGAGNVLVSGSAGGPYRIEFVGDLAGANVGAVTLDDSLLEGPAAAAGVSETQEGGTGVNEIQSVTVEAGGGTFTLSYSGQTTAAIAYNAAATVVQAALEDLANIGSGQVSVTGDDGGPWAVEFTGTLAETNVDLMTADDASLTGLAASVSGVVTRAGGTTWRLDFTPMIPATDVPGNDDPITFLPQQLEIKIGDGNLTYTEHKEYDYLLDRGNLDTVREGDEVPMDVRIECVYEHITTGTGENISPLDALKQKGAAIEWVGASADPCEPYSVDVEVFHEVPCGTSQDETTLFPDFRHETAEINLKEATISLTGKCNATEPIVTRS